MKEWRPWTDEEKEILMRLRGGGAKFNAIGNVIGRAGPACKAMYNNIAQHEHYQAPDYEGRIRENDGMLGSRALRDSLENYFRCWEQTHGFQPGAGKLLVPAGYDPVEQRIAA